jgi:pimeloyl-ACP methyl ester carboxylesterase
MPYARRPDTRIYYEVHGEGEPLLLVPGFGCSVEIFEFSTPVLAERFRVIVFDPRGHGRSDSPADGYTMAAYADDAAAVLDAAGAEAAHVVGTSFGGMIAQHLALDHPSRVKKLVLACTGAGGEHHVAPPLEDVAAFVAAASEPDMAKAVRMRFPMNYSDAFVATEADAIVARAQRDAHLRNDAGTAGQLLAVNGHDTWDRLPKVSAPTLVLHGSDDGIVPLANGRALAARIPNARLKVYDGARHVFFIERAAQFNADVLAFLAD